jgi:hypothetical protein
MTDPVAAITITAADQLLACDAIETGARAALAYVHDHDNLEQPFSLEATARLVVYANRSAESLAGAWQTVMEALALSDVTGERLGLARGELLTAVLADLRDTYEQRLSNNNEPDE